MNTRYWMAMSIKNCQIPSGNKGAATLVQSNPDIRFSLRRFCIRIAEVSSKIRVSMYSIVIGSKQFDIDCRLACCLAKQQHVK